MEKTTSNKLYQLQNYLNRLINNEQYGMTKATPQKIEEIKKAILIIKGE